MSALLRHTSSGIPLSFILKNELSDWQAQQPAFIQNWLTNTGFEKQGVALIPDAKTGELSQVFCLMQSSDDFWAAGNLANTLPTGTYQIQGESAFVEQVALGFVLGGYEFSEYKEKPTAKAQLAISDKALFERISQQADAITLARDLVNTPAVDMMPQHLSQVMEDLAATYNGEFSQWIGDELLEQNYPTIHMVGRASENKPRLLDLKWGATDAPLITLVGKGVCFDSGGLDLKPSSGMRNMKKDMGGAAHVIALAQLIMAANLPIRLRVLVPAVENAVSRNAFRPGDVVKTRKGIMVEIDNTDAEGRLVLCDALSEAQNDNPELIIDFATLTGACRVALGTELPGFFSTERDVANGIIDAGLSVHDPVWQLPLFEQYKNLLKSDVADMANCASTPFGGAITAALYLKEFVEPTTPWVHFDVMAWNLRALPGRPTGGEALGIRAVFNYLQNRFNK
ncbi:MULTISPECIES: leucyl aminopeptidase family protein [unclassified Pseudoalteromonas]|uniref:leucyl aminopeptidase family protein n=1 Tax=unclassified Pseudoalteromonas TaxID=194690 RepID=UPI0004635355|nr:MULTISPECIES: leucyl aminopeptidase family protein [unclassified Pseudoalteromonas]MBH0000075.1 leucyl aminopeptidase family protein [Pseudoalteromonas sp. NSLLW24]MBH0004803.1 leucyl aminopeptidase family protein [Pseudoalteromonas sp. SWYJZ12]MBH0025792.1 leucyl aminopeptidase family protein [Pseudoalteromonas sp. SWN29]MBH0029964.1 leucyl aminopeptidase family protein [Pseudoalteromonas sp. SWYJZ98]MBH0077251.1 leucyl aminopeptidase family protein [Pseudoalteromonas sp. SWYJ118]